MKYSDGCDVSRGCVRHPRSIRARNDALVQEGRCELKRALHRKHSWNEDSHNEVEDWQIQYSFLELLCAYGYSMTVFIPVSVREKTASRALE